MEIITEPIEVIRTADTMESLSQNETISIRHNDVINYPVKPSLSVRFVVSILHVICGGCAILLGALNIYFRRNIHLDLEQSSKRMVDGSAIFIGVIIIISGSIGILSVVKNKISVVIIYWCILLVTSFAVYVAAWFTISDIKEGKEDKTNCIQKASSTVPPNYCDGHQGTRLVINILLCAVFVTSILTSGLAFCYEAMQSSCHRHSKRQNSMAQSQRHLISSNATTEQPPPYNEIYILQENSNTSRNSTVLTAEVEHEPDEEICCSSIFRRATDSELEAVQRELGMR